MLCFGYSYFYIQIESVFIFIVGFFCYFSFNMMINYSYLFIFRDVFYSYQIVFEVFEFQVGKFLNYEILVFRKIDGW